MPSSVSHTTDLGIRDSHEKARHCDRVATVRPHSDTGPHTSTVARLHTQSAGLDRQIDGLDRQIDGLDRQIDVAHCDTCHVDSPVSSCG